MTLHRLARTTAVVLAVTAIGPPAAAARPMGETRPIGMDDAPFLTPQGGFDFGSAGVGAAAGGAIVLLSVGGVALSMRARARV